MSTRRSKRIRRRRKWCSQACVRSATQRTFPRPLPCEATTPRNTGGDTAIVKDAPASVAVVTRVGVDAARTAQRPPTHAANRHDGLNQRHELCDVVTVGASEDCRDRRSMASVARWRLEPGRARSVELGPVFRPSQPRESTKSRRPHVRSLSCPLLARSPVAPRAIDPTRRLAANRAVCANNSRLTRIPFPLVSRPNECPSSAQTGCLSKPRDPVPACDRDT